MEIPDLKTALEILQKGIAADGYEVVTTAKARKRRDETANLIALGRAEEIDNG